MMAEHHNKLTTGHLGYNKTLELLGRNYNLLDMKNYVETYIAMCNVYFRVKILYHKLFGLLQPLLILDRVWKSVSTDVIMKLPPSRDPDQPKGGEFNSI